MQDAITTGKYQGMLVAALDGHGLYPTIKQAIAKGIKVATVDYTLGLPQQQVNLVADPGPRHDRRPADRQRVEGPDHDDQEGVRESRSAPASRATSRSCPASPTTRPT